MRKLITSDIPAFCRALKRIGIKDRIKEITKSADGISDVFDAGFDLLWNIFDVATEQSGEKHIYEFLSLPFEMDPQEVADLPIDDFFKLCEQLATENDLRGFFERARGLMARKSLTSSSADTAL